MIFALIHACLGWALASLAARALAQRSASARCWAWRLGLLKGPLAFLLAVPIFIPVSLPLTVSATALSPSLNQGIPMEGAGRSLSGPTVSSFEIDPWLVLYGVGIVVLLAIRFVAARRVDDQMPRVVGALRPRIVVPDRLSPSASAMVVAHETAHIRRRDPLWSLVADVVCVAFWFAPPVWLCARAMRAEAEAACDAEALAQTGATRSDYARLLLTFAGPAPANALGGPARRLARRIQLMKNNPKPLSRCAAGAFLIVALAALTPWRAEAAQEKAHEYMSALAPDRLAKVKMDQWTVSPARKGKLARIVKDGGKKGAMKTYRVITSDGNVLYLVSVGRTIDLRKIKFDGQPVKLTDRKFLADVDGKIIRTRAGKVWHTGKSKSANVPIWVQVEPRVKSVPASKPKK